MRVERAWVEPREREFHFSCRDPRLHRTKNFFPILNLYRIQRPRKPLETRFCDLKRSDNAIIEKIVVSEVDFRVLQTNDWTNRAMQLKCITRVLGLSSVKISAQSARYLALHLIRTRTRRRRRRWNKHASHMIPKTPPGVSKITRIRSFTKRNQYNWTTNSSFSLARTVLSSCVNNKYVNVIRVKNKLP